MQLFQTIPQRLLMWISLPTSIVLLQSKLGCQNYSLAPLKWRLEFNRTRSWTSRTTHGRYLSCYIRLGYAVLTTDTLAHSVWKNLTCRTRTLDLVRVATRYESFLPLETGFSRAGLFVLTVIGLPVLLQQY